MMCRACRANEADTPGGLCLVCTRDRLALPPTSPRRHGPAKGRRTSPIGWRPDPSTKPRGPGRDHRRDPWQQRLTPRASTTSWSSRPGEGWSARRRSSRVIIGAHDAGTRLCRRWAWRSWLQPTGASGPQTSCAGCARDLLERRHARRGARVTAPTRWRALTRGHSAMQIGRRHRSWTVPRIEGLRHPTERRRRARTVDMATVSSAASTTYRDEHYASLCRLHGLACRTLRDLPTPTGRPERVGRDEARLLSHGP